MRHFASLSFALMMLLFTACASNPPAGVAALKKMDSAAFDSYVIQVIASDASQVICDYGTHREADYPLIPAGKSLGRSGFTLWDKVFPEMKCTWTAADGSRQKEVIDVPKLFKNKHVEWEHIEGEQVVTHEPIQDNTPYFYFELQDKQFRVTSKFTVMLLGEKIDETSRHVKLIDINRIIFERRK